MSIKLLIVDDHLVIREGLKILLQADGIQIAGEAADGQKAFKLIRKLRPDVVLLDVRMPCPMLPGVKIGRHPVDQRDAA